MGEQTSAMMCKGFVHILLLSVCIICAAALSNDDVVPEDTTNMERSVDSAPSSNEMKLLLSDGGQSDGASDPLRLTEGKEPEMKLLLSDGIQLDEQPDADLTQTQWGGAKKTFKKVSKSAKKGFKKASKSAKKGFKKASKGAKKGWKKVSKGAKKGLKKVSKGAKKNRKSCKK